MKAVLANRVTVRVTLGNGSDYAWAWMTPTTFGRCPSKGLRWARRELTRARAIGRSTIVRLKVEVERTGEPWRLRRKARR